MNSSFSTVSRLAMVFVVLGGASLLGACAIEATEVDNPTLAEEAAEVEPEAVATAQQLTWFGWTPSTSEEGLVISCSEGSLVSKFECSGSYCDNIRAFCQPAVSVSTNHYWTNWFSEESGGNGSCGEGYWVTGFSCKGSYCDSLSVECSNAPGFTYTDCYYTGWMSEENGGRIEFQPGYYARSVYCNGSYCDNMRFKVCRAIAEES